MPKTKEEITALKRSWLSDPCFDIEATEGFEDHRQELIDFRDYHNALRAEERQAQLARKAMQIGAPGNLTLAEYVEGLEYQIDRLSQRVIQLEGVMVKF